MEGIATLSFNNENHFLVSLLGNFVVVTPFTQVIFVHLHKVVPYYVKLCTVISIYELV